ncbi:MAG: FAD-dependent oxidoreductase, partial [Gammaproteobacteria bacterium]|nr:FAD-dependent oxidoreductase [Gammaproteobacteria bacterium]
VKPVAGFLERLERLESHWRNAPPARAWQLVSVGGGPSSLEVLLALQHRFATPVHGAPATHVHAHLLYPGNTPLPGYPLRVQRRVRALLAERGVHLHEGFRVAQVEAAHLLAADGRTLPYDQLIWATSAGAPDWAAQAGLATDAAGFIRVDPYLRSLSHPTIFASGDLAALPGPPHPKSGVLAVRQGPILFHNLRGACLGQPLRAYQAQARMLSLISTGHRHALATRGDWLLEGGWVWRWKDWIDRRFMAQFAKGERPH